MNCQSEILKPMTLIDTNDNYAYNVVMATLNIRNLSGSIHTSLRIRAAKAGRSMEAEARQIITDVCSGSGKISPAHSLQALVDDLYGTEKPRNITDRFIEERHKLEIT